MQARARFAAWKSGGLTASLAAVLLALAGAAAAGADPGARLAAQLGYRLDRALGAVDAAQRHALVARLLLARARDELTPDASLATLWLAWEERLERLERETGLAALPAWYAPVRPGTVEAVIASVRSDQAELVWADPLWGDGQAAAGLTTLTDAPERVSARALQPGVLAWARSHAPELWEHLLAWLEEEPEWRPLVHPLIAPWLALPPGSPLAEWQALGDRSARELAALGQAPDGAPTAPLSAAVDVLVDPALAADRVRGRPPVAAEYRRFLNGGRDDVARGLVALARAAGGLEDGRYAEFVGCFLALLLVSVDTPGRLPVEPLAAELDRLDPVLLPWLTRVDPRLINVYQRARQLLRQPPGDASAKRERRRELAALDAALGLTTPVLDAYLQQPLRAPFERELAVCFGLTRSADGPPQPLRRAQFDACVAGLAAWAVEAARLPELAGQPAGPFGPLQLEREARLNAWQRINYWVGYLGRELAPACGSSGAPLANPLEWSLAARALTWFVDRWPTYGSAETRVQLRAVEGAGRRTLRGLASLQRCARAAGPLGGGFARYAAALEDFEVALETAADAFRAAELVAGADLVLDGGASQETTYRPEALVVGPCGGTASCGMERELEASRALFSLFPDVYLLAHQARLGEVTLCYRDVAWVERRAELPPVRTQAMARYFGHLGFALEGRYSGQEAPVFAMRLVSPDEYEYLFGENAPDVLSDPCPRHRLDTQVQAELPKRGINLVPRRLTFMTADRMHPERVFELHWASGQEWRDWFVTGRGVEEIARADPKPVREAVARRLERLRDARDSRLYEALLAVGVSLEEGAEDPLGRAMETVETRKRILAVLARLLVPRSLEEKAALRATFYGESGLFDRETVLRLRQSGLGARSIVAEAQARLLTARRAWANRADAPGAAEPDRIAVAGLLALRATLARLAGPALADVDGDDEQVQDGAAQ